MRCLSMATAGILFLFSCLLSHEAWAERTLNPAILVVGASFESASTPFNDRLEAPFGGIAVNVGSYLSLGNALVRSPILDGFVVNEAQAGATSFDRLGCNPGPNCGPAGWQGFEKQFAKALARVTVRNPANPSQILSYNADYLVVGTGNDCLHSDSFGVPQDQAVKCSVTELNAYVDRLLAVGNAALSLGITPVYYSMPAYDDVDLPLMASLSGFRWIMNEQEYNQMRALIRSRITAELPGALFVDAWENFTHIGDGIHPSPHTAEWAAHRIAHAVRFDWGRKWRERSRHASAR